MEWNMHFLINGPSCKGLNLFLVNGGLSGTDPKSLETNGSASSGGADTPKGEATGCDKDA